MTTFRASAALNPGAANGGLSGSIATNVVGDWVIVVIHGKPGTGATPLAVRGFDAGSVPYSFTLIKSGLNLGTGSQAADTGTIATYVYIREATAVMTTLEVDTSGGGWNTISISSYSYLPDVGSSFANLIGSDVDWVQILSDVDTANPLTAVSAAFANPPKVGGAILAVGAHPTDFGATGTHTISATGLTGGTVNQRLSTVNTLGNDIGVVAADLIGHTGTASSGVTVSLSVLGTNGSGSIAVVVLDEVLGIARQATGSLTLSGSADAAGTQPAVMSGSITLGAATTPAVGVTPPPPPQRAGGRYRKGTGRLLWEPYVAVPVRPPGVHVYDLASAFSVPTFPVAYTQPVYDVSYAYKIRDRDRIVVGNKDVSEWRGARTPAPSYQLIIPMRYGPGILEMPQVNAVFERPGHGALRFMRPGAKVMLQRVNDADEVVSTDYIGFVVGYRTDGADLAIELGGELSGRAALVDKQVPIFRSRHDAGEMLWEDCRDAGVTLKPRLGAQTGVRLWKFGGGMSVADHINQVCALATKRSNATYTVMPDAEGVYRVVEKDVTTHHGTIYFDDARVKQSLIRDIAEEPNRVFVAATAPNGRRIRFATYPGLVQGPAPIYPIAGGDPFGPGTEDGDTINGDGVTLMINRLVVTNFLNFGNDSYPGGYDDDVADAIEDLQEKAGLSVTGNMNVKTWNALFDLSATGYHLNWSKILPAADDTRVRRWLRTASGSIRKANPQFQRGRIKVDASIEMGNGFWEFQARNFARKELRLTTTGNWVGEVTTKCSFVWGDHTPGDPITDVDVMAPRDVVPGMNLWAPLWDGGTLFHVAGITVSEDGDRVSLALDTQFRDTLKVWQIIERNRESRRDPARTWMQQHRRSQLVPDALGPWDNVGGTIERVDLEAGVWKVFPIVAGQEGTIARLRMHTDNEAAEFVVAIFGQRIYPNKLKNKIGNPMGTGADNWKNEKIRRDLDKSNILLYVAGDDEDPCGYYPRTKSEGGTRTGKWYDDAGIQYRTFRHPVLWVAVYADRNCHLRAGRIAWPQLEGGL